MATGWIICLSEMTGFPRVLMHVLLDAECRMMISTASHDDLQHTENATGETLGPRVNAAHEEILHILRKTIKNVVTVPIKPIKPIPKLQNAVTVPKKTKKTIPQESWRLGGSASGLRRNWFYWFFWYSFSIWQLWD